MMLALLVADAVLIGSPCLDEALDVDSFVQILRLELAAGGTRTLDVVGPGAPPAQSGQRVLEVLGCQDPGPTILVRAARRDARIPLRDVRREARPRVLALAAAELAQGAWSEPPPAPAPPVVVTQPAAVAVERPAPPAYTRGPWGGSMSLETRVTTNGALAGFALGVERWSERIAIHAGAGVHFGQADGRNVEALLAAAGLTFRGPALGRLRLDVDLGVETGAVWRATNLGDTVLDAVIGGSAALVGRLRLSERWDGTLAVGYERAYTGESADLLNAHLGFVRSF